MDDIYLGEECLSRIEGILLFLLFPNANANANANGDDFSVKRALKRRGWLEKPCDCCPKLPRCQINMIIMMMISIIIMIITITGAKLR